MQFQDMPPEVRAEIVEYLQPTISDQEELRERYQIWREDEASAKWVQSLGPEWIQQLEKEKQQAKRSKSNYHELLEKTSKIPGIWHTYRYFWDKSKPFPDQGPDPSSSGSSPITT
jgi:hypothetical protein